MSEHWAEIGEEVIFLARNGYPFQLENALQHFEPGQMLVVTDRHIGDWESSYRFKGHTGSFNTVMFEPFRAQAIEAQRAETVKQGSVADESAVANGDAPKGVGSEPQPQARAA